MSIKKLIKIIATCDGPCGAVLEVDAVRLPEGWIIVKVEQPFPGSGEASTLRTSGLCPKCAERFYQILNHEGYSLQVWEKRSEPKAVAKV